MKFDFTWYPFDTQKIILPIMTGKLSEKNLWNRICKILSAVQFQSSDSFGLYKNSSRALLK